MTVLEMIEAMTDEEFANWTDDSNCNAGKTTADEDDLGTTATVRMSRHDW